MIIIFYFKDLFQNDDPGLQNMSEVSFQTFVSLPSQEKKRPRRRSPSVRALEKKAVQDGTYPWVMCSEPGSDDQVSESPQKRDNSRQEREVVTVKDSHKTVTASSTVVRVERGRHTDDEQRQHGQDLKDRDRRRARKGREHRKDKK